MTIYTAAITLILVMDPLGNVPLFLSVLKNTSSRKQAWVIFRETFIAFTILTVFLFFGRNILHGLHITQAALNIAGGIILFIIALRMIFPHPDVPQHGESIQGEPFIVPLAIPLIAGPASLATVMLFASQQPSKMFSWFIALLIAAVFCTLVLLCSRFLMKILRERGLIALERLMGMILTTLAVQMFLTGLDSYL
ncbi:MAG: MarC family protein [Gammaproteobacteria bacterium]